MARQVLSAIHGPMLAASAAETHLKVGELPLYEAFDMVVYQIVDVIQELRHPAVILQELDNLLVQASELPVMLILSGIVNSPAVEHVSTSITSRIHRNAFFISETEYPDFQSLILSYMIELGHCRELCQDLVQIRIVRERSL